jgi:hypothetical protein
MSQVCPEHRPEVWHLHSRTLGNSIGVGLRFEFVSPLIFFFFSDFLPAPGMHEPFHSCSLSGIYRVDLHAPPRYWRRHSETLSSCVSRFGLVGDFSLFLRDFWAEFLACSRNEWTAPGFLPNLAGGTSDPTGWTPCTSYVLTSSLGVHGQLHFSFRLGLRWQFVSPVIC